MPSHEPEDWCCPKCGSSRNESVVARASFCVRCADCRARIAATSWMAVGPNWESRVRVFRDGEEEAGPVLEGLGSDLWERIQALADGGITLVLRAAE